MAWRSAAQTLRSWWSCVRIIQVGQPTAGRKRQSRDPSLPPNLAGMGSIARHRAVRKTQSRHVLPEGGQVLSRVRPRRSDSLLIIPGGPEGPGRGSVALRSWVDSLPLRWLRHLRPGMTRSHATHPVMAGLVPAIPMRKSAVPRSIGITGTRPVMT